MRTYTYSLAGADRAIHYTEDDNDLAAFRAWVDQGHRFVAFDTETTGLDTFSTRHRLRLAQFGTRSEAWVIPVEIGVRFADAARYALKRLPDLVCHNATYDLLVVDRHLRGCPLELTYPKTWDTYTMSHLIDPRAKSEGGIGHGLKELAAFYVDADAPDTAAGLYSIFRTEYKATKETGWAAIDIDHPTYVTYAGLDVILTSELFDVLAPKCLAEGWDNLLEFERQVALVCARMERRGMLADHDYLAGLKIELAQEEDHYKKVAAEWGVSTIGSGRQVAASLLAMGEKLTVLTDSGVKANTTGMTPEELAAKGWLATGKEILLPMADLTPSWERIGAREPNPLAEAVAHAKRASKWSTSYVDAMLLGADAQGRVHPKINPLRARTARMSISSPPLQQLPSGDWKIRRALLADPGELIVAVDYSQVEMRALAALSGDRRMIEAIASGADLHDNTARLMYGPDFTKAQRKLAKIAGFGKVYGGGAAVIAAQTGVSMEIASEASRLFDRAYPAIKRYGRKLQDRVHVTGERWVTTPSGRRLPLDGQRLYAGTNYVVQSTCRDVLAQGLLEMEEAGLVDYLLLPVHDEVIASVPEGDAEEVARAIQRCMETDFYGVFLAADPEVYGDNWGMGYKGPSARG